MNKYLFAAIIVIIFFGCSNYRNSGFNPSGYHTSGVITGMRSTPLPKFSMVQTVLIGEAPELEIVGMIQVVAPKAHHDIEIVVNQARIKAREMGCNFIVLEGKAYLKSSSPGTSGYTDNKGRYTEGTQPSVSEYPSYSFIAGRLK
jgi:hypothetical protein